MLNKYFNTPHESGLGKTLYQFNGLLVLTFFILTFLVWGGTGYSAGIMLLLSPLALFVKDRPLQITKEHYLIILAFSLMFVAHASAIYRGNSAAEITDLDQPMRFILIIPIFLYLKKVGFNQTWFWLGIYLAGLICGWQSIAYTAGEYGTRVSGPFNPIIWGDIGLVFCLVIGVKIHHLIKNKPQTLIPKYIELSTAAISLIAASIGVILSGSRGAWLTVILLALLFLTIAFVTLPKRISLAFTSVMIICSVLAYAYIPTVNVRINQVINELSSFELTSSNRSSTGLRLQMWYTSIIAFQESPIIGLGKSGLTELEKRLVNEDKINNWVVTESSQQHSDLFDMLAKSGALGVLILIFFYYSTMKAGSALIPPYSSTIVMTTLAYIGFGLTNTIFIGMNGTMFFLVFTVFTIVAGEREVTSK